MKLTITIDPGACISAANCVGMAPDFFEIGGEPYVELIDKKGEVLGTEHTFEVTPEEAELLHEAAEACPTRAISVVERP